MEPLQNPELWVALILGGPPALFGLGYLVIFWLQRRTR